MGQRRAAGAEACTTTLPGQKAVASLSVSLLSALIATGHSDHNLRVWDARRKQDSDYYESDCSDESGPPGLANGLLVHRSGHYLSRGKRFAGKRTIKY